MSLPAPIPIDRVLDDPEQVWSLARRGAPYPPVQRYFQSQAEQAALGGRGGASQRPLVIAPVFRGDWATPEPRLPGVEALLDNPRFIEAARTLFSAEIVRPHLVYINLTLPMPVYDRGHTDVPAFRGVDRARVPIWLPVVMGRSGLFQRWRIPIATAVSWWYAGEGGGLTCWPDGPDGAPRTVPPTPNTALVGDNDRMPHRVEGVGPTDAGFPRGLSLDSLLAPTRPNQPGADWVVAAHGVEQLRVPEAAVRISVSWKARVFVDAAAAALADSHADDLDLETVWATFAAELARRDQPLAVPASPLRDPAFIAALNAAFPAPRPRPPAPPGAEA